MFTSLSNWLARPVLEVAEVDRPFRLRRVSVLLLAGGWVVFLVSCLIGTWLARHNVPILGYVELTQCRGVTNSVNPYLQILRGVTEAVGGAAFIGGMLSVAVFDRLDERGDARTR